MKYFRELESCRICDGVFYPESIPLKDSPLANELYNSREEALGADVFPLEVVMCQSCKHIQLKHIVLPERLFSEYVYASGTSKTFRDHFEVLAERISSLVTEGIVLEVGSNDGTLLQAITNKGLRSIGVEPSKTLADISESKCEAVYTSFLDEELSNLLKQKYNEFDLVVGNNVFAHIDDLMGAFRITHELLKDGGFLIFEVAHALKLAENHLFDTIYHEHMSYHTVTSLTHFMHKIGFSIFDIEEIDMHGGSIRVICQKNGSKQEIDSRVQEILNREVLAKLDSNEWIKDFNLHLEVLLAQTKEAIAAAPTKTTWFGYGAPAKAVTFINEFELDLLDLVGIIDDNPGKQGKFLPTSGVGIFSQEAMESVLIPNLETGDLRCVIFPWNLSTEITSKLKGFSKYAMKVIWFLPRYKEVEL